MNDRDDWLDRLPRLGTLTEEASSGPPPRTGWLTVWSVAAALYPVFIHLLIHGVWAATWEHEGRRPCAASEPAPGGWFILGLAWLMLVASPLAVAASLLLASADPRHQGQGGPGRAWVARGLVALAAVTWGCSLVLALADPFGAIVWLLD
jgi:hypothetical protein